MRRLLIICMLVILLLICVAPAAMAFVDYACDMIDTFQKGSAGWYTAWAACIIAWIMDSGTGDYW